LRFGSSDTPALSVCGGVKCVKLLLTGGANKDAKTQGGSTALITAKIVKRNK
jgi:hypothetical protein